MTSKKKVILEMHPLALMQVRTRGKENIWQEVKFTGTTSKGIKPFLFILFGLNYRIYIRTGDAPDM
jgi:hypothetical protein